MKHTKVIKQTLDLKVIVTAINIEQIQRHEKWAVCTLCQLSENIL